MAYDQTTADLLKQAETLKAAIRQAIKCLDTDRNLTDAEIEGTGDIIRQRRYALRHCQAALACTSNAPLHLQGGAPAEPCKRESGCSTGG
jgi:hypothetical protein